jgi:hypothetical protein
MFGDVPHRITHPPKELRAERDALKSERDLLKAERDGLLLFDSFMSEPLSNDEVSWLREGSISDGASIAGKDLSDGYVIGIVRVRTRWSTIPRVGVPFQSSAMRCRVMVWNEPVRCFHVFMSSQDGCS